MEIDIYYEYEPIMGVNSQYKNADGAFVHDYFPSLYLFKVTMSLEFPDCRLIEINDNNYPVFLQSGVIDA